jgi:VanZ family protein
MNGEAIAIRRPQPSKWSEWLPILLWAAVMFTFSTQGFSAENTSHIIAPLVRWFFPAISSTSLGVINALIRKCAHFTEYGILFWLLVRGPLKGRPFVAMAVCIGFALTDEFHQTFVPGRGPSFYDVALDSTGAMFAGFLRAAITELI